LPFTQALSVLARDIEGDVIFWFGRLMNQPHPSLFRGPACLSVVAGDAGTDYIFPGMLSPAMAGDNMVYGKLLDLPTAILAGVAVTMEDPKSGKLPFGAGAPYKIAQFDYRRYGEGIINRANEAQTVLQHLGLALNYQYYRPTCPADIEWLVALIKYQDWTVIHSLNSSHLGFTLF
jgi:hypothetical protein